MPALDPISWISIGGVTHGTLLSVALLLRRETDARLRRAHAFLAVLLLALSYTILVLWLYHTRMIVNVPILIGTQTPLVFAFGPLVYLFFRSWLTGRPVAAVDALHGLPFIIYVIYLGPLYLLPAELKVSGVLGAFYSDSPDYRFTQLVHVTAMLLHIGAYVCISWILARRERRHEETRVRAALGVLVGMWVLILARFVLTAVSTATTATTVHALPTVTAVCISSLLLLTLRRAPLVDSLKRKLPAEIVASASSWLEYVMREKRLFLDADLSLSDLAGHVDMRADEVSRLLNDEIGTSFANFVNRFRVQHAAALLVDSRYAHLSAAAIGIESGFGARSSFYRAFRQFKGTTPAAFQKKMSASMIPDNGHAGRP